MNKVTDTEINEGVKLILARMESNPEEFTKNHQTGWTKWHDIMSEVIVRVEGTTVLGRQTHVSCLTQEEVEMLYNKYQSLRRNEFTSLVLRMITTGERGYEDELVEQAQLKLKLNTMTQPVGIGVAPNGIIGIANGGGGAAINNSSTTWVSPFHNKV